MLRLDAAMSAHAPPKSLWFALATNLALALAALAAALYTGSVAMQAQTVLALTVAAHQGLLFWSMYRRSNHMEQSVGGQLYFASFTVAVMLFCLGGLYSMYEGVRRLSDPEAIQGAWLAMGILLLGMLAQLVALWASIQTANCHRGSDAVWPWLRSMRRRELIVLVAESLLGLLGLSLNFLCVGLAALADNATYDAFGAMASGCVLLMLAGWVAAQINNLLLGRAVDERRRTMLEAMLAEHPAVVALNNLMIVPQGEYWLVAVKLQFAGDDESERQRQLAQLEAAILDRFAAIKWLYLVPEPPVAGGELPGNESLP